MVVILHEAVKPAIGSNLSRIGHNLHEAITGEICLRGAAQCNSRLHSYERRVTKALHFNRGYKMRKFVILTATAAMALSLSACKGKEEAPAATATSEAATADASAAPSADASAPAASEAPK